MEVVREKILPDFNAVYDGTPSQYIYPYNVSHTTIAQTVNQCTTPYRTAKQNAPRPADIKKPSRPLPGKDLFTSPTNVSLGQVITRGEEQAP
jgi:hypothetical protein